MGPNLSPLPVYPVFLILHLLSVTGAAVVCCLAAVEWVLLVLRADLKGLAVRTTLLSKKIASYFTLLSKQLGHFGKLRAPTAMHLLMDSRLIIRSSTWVHLEATECISLYY